MTTLLLVLAGLGGGTVGLGLMACVAARRMARMEQRIAALRHLLAAAAAPRTTTAGSESQVLVMMMGRSRSGPLRPRHRGGAA